MTDQSAELTDAELADTFARTLSGNVAEWPQLRPLLGRCATGLHELAKLREQVERLKEFERLFNHAIECVDRVFQERSDRPPPLLPDFCGFESVILLAKAFITKCEQVEQLTAELEKSQTLCLTLMWRPELDNVLVGDLREQAVEIRDRHNRTISAMAETCAKYAKRLDEAVGLLRWWGTKCVGGESTGVPEFLTAYDAERAEGKVEG